MCAHNKISLGSFNVSINKYAEKKYKGGNKLSPDFKAVITSLRLS
jgi:hypothetical protein